MKHLLRTPIILAAAVCLIVSCKKEKHAPAPVPTRTLKFILYTDKDFSDDDHNISFSLHISNGKSAPFDSTVAMFKIKDIPHKANQLVFEKRVPDDGTTLTVGFVYTIEGIGVGWRLDTLGANQKSKTVEYPFE
ncbi:hypothetical protein [Mucilaginibacter sp.]|jgi:hypothetical protein|uniref:hypothetical protein n=1 Tax=Mucilaginibacter sp. TaxID=1882438 RepID=UPI002BFF49EF|nr:hypothetical protein [Mucilaginibacter sp.]HTI61275.1 hypothetical protein [Mucilaginibacter sp.]